jgi:hypothetical protein
MSTDMHVMMAKLISALGKYPDVDQRDLEVLQQNTKTEKIASGLFRRDMQGVSSGDFIAISDDGSFLLSAGMLISVFGLFHRDEHFLKLAIDLFSESSERLPLGIDRATAVMSEANARVSLAEMGISTVENLECAHELNERAREEGFVLDTQEYGLTLLNQAIILNALAGIDRDAETNLKRSIEFARRSREEGLPKNSDLYAKSLMTEGNAAQMLGGLGQESIQNFELAIDLLVRARNEGLIEDAPDYPRNLIAEADTRVMLAGMGMRADENVDAALDLYREAQKSRHLSDEEREMIERNLRGEAATAGCDCELL